MAVWPWVLGGIVILGKKKPPEKEVESKAKNVAKEVKANEGAVNEPVKSNVTGFASLRNNVFETKETKFAGTDLGHFRTLNFGNFKTQPAIKSPDKPFPSKGEGAVSNPVTIQTSFGGQVCVDIPTIKNIGRLFALAMLAPEKVNKEDAIFKPFGVTMLDTDFHKIADVIAARIAYLSGCGTQGWIPENPGIYRWGDNDFVVPYFTRDEVKQVLMKNNPERQGIRDVRSLVCEFGIPVAIDTFFKTIKAGNKDPLQQVISLVSPVAKSALSPYTGGVIPTQSGSSDKDIFTQILEGLYNVCIGWIVDAFNAADNQRKFEQKFGVSYATFKSFLNIRNTWDDLSVTGKDTNAPSVSPFWDYIIPASHHKALGPFQGAYPGIMLFATFSDKIEFSAFNESVGGDFWLTNPQIKNESK